MSSAELKATGVIAPTRFGAILFDLDGVLTSTAKVHAAAWKKVFDEFLITRSGRLEEPFNAFDQDLDYERYVDGKPRYDGVRSFLASRSITLREGNAGLSSFGRVHLRPGEQERRAGARRNTSRPC